MKLFKKHLRIVIGGRPLLLLVGVLALMGLLAACGGDDDPTPTSPATTGDGTGDGGAQVDAVQEFLDGTWEVLWSSTRSSAFAGTTIKRIIEDTYPNVTITLFDSRAPEVLADMAKNPSAKANTIYQDTEIVWSAYPDLGAAALVAGVPDPGEAPLIAFPVHPASQMAYYSGKDFNSLYDLDGVNVYLGANAEDLVYKIRLESLQEVAGVKIRQIISPEVSSDLLMEGTADVVARGTIFQLSVSGDMAAFAQTNQLRIIDQTIEILDEMLKRHPSWLFLTPSPVCSSAFSKAMRLDYQVISPDYEGTFSVAGDNCIAAANGFCFCLYAFDDLPEELMYRIMSAYLENEDEIVAVYPGPDWMAKIYQERLGHVFEAKEAFHPGTRRAFEEFGKTYGVDGVVEWEAQQDNPDQWWLSYVPQ